MDNPPPEDAAAPQQSARDAENAASTNEHDDGDEGASLSGVSNFTTGLSVGCLPGSTMEISSIFSLLIFM